MKVDTVRSTIRDFITEHKGRVEPSSEERLAIDAMILVASAQRACTFFQRGSLVRVMTTVAPFDPDLRDKLGELVAENIQDTSLQSRMFFTEDMLYWVFDVTILPHNLIATKELLGVWFEEAEADIPQLEVFVRAIDLGCTIEEAQRELGPTTHCAGQA